MDKKELDPAAGMSLALALFALHLKQHTQVDKMTDVGRNLLMMMLVTGCLSVVAVLVDTEERLKQQHQVLSTVVEHVHGELYESQNKRRVNDNDNCDSNRKHRRTLHDHERAWQCIEQDCLGPEPTFTDKQFEEVFRLAKSKVERLMQVCCRHKPKTFNPGPDATGKPGIRPEVKVLSVFKCVAFGCSGVAFRDYHQMARNATSECLKDFFYSITVDEELAQTELT